MEYFEIYRDNTKQIYAEDVLEFPDSKHWGNLSNKMYFIFKRLDYLNNLLESIDDKIKTYQFNFNNRNGLNSKVNTVAPFIEIIHVMSDLRMIIDELISLLYIIEKREITGDYPLIIDVDSIGTFLKKTEMLEYVYLDFFKEYKDFLKIVNDITDTYKHSFINDHILFFSQLDKPTVFAIKAATEKNHNKFDLNENRLIKVYLEDIVKDFNKMFTSYRVYLRKKIYG